MQTTSQRRIAAKEIAEVIARIAELQTLLADMKSDYERRFGKAYAAPRPRRIVRPCENVAYILGGIGGYNDYVVRCPKCGKQTMVYAVGQSDFKKFQEGKDTLDYISEESRRALETGLCHDCQGKEAKG